MSFSPDYFSNKPQLYHIKNNSSYSRLEVLVIIIIDKTNIISTCEKLFS